MSKVCNCLEAVIMAGQIAPSHSKVLKDGNFVAYKEGKYVLQKVDPVKDVVRWEWKDLELADLDEIIKSCNEVKLASPNISVRFCEIEFLGEDDIITLRNLCKRLKQGECDIEDKSLKGGIVDMEGKDE